MAKKKAKPAGRAKPAPPTASPANQKDSHVAVVKAIRDKYQDNVPKRPGQAADKVRREIRQARQPIYSLNRKIKEAPTRYYKAKYRKEKRALEAQLQPQLSALIERREDFKTLARNYEAIRKEKTAIRRQLKRINTALTKADEEGNYKELERLTYQVLKLEGNIDALSKQLGLEIKTTPVEDYQPSDEEDEAGYLEDPANPYTIWQAIAQLDKDEESGNFKYFIINGKRLSAESVINITLESSKFWRSLKKPQTDTPRVNRSFNLTRETVKYTAFK